MLKTSLLRSLGQSSRLSSDVVLRINFSAAAAVAASARVQHAVVGTATITQQQNQEPDQQQQEQQQQQAKRVDPFTSAMQNKTEKELMEQMLRQAEEQVLAEDAAEQVQNNLCLPIVALSQLVQLLVPSDADWLPGR